MKPAGEQCTTFFLYILEPTTARVCLLIHADGMYSKLQDWEEGREEQLIHWICAIWENRDKQEKQGLPSNFAAPWFQVLSSVLGFGRLWPSDMHTCIYVCMSACVKSWRYSAQLVIAGQFGASAEVYPPHHHHVLAVSRHGVASLWGRKWEQTM